jgi:hypothetical protein
MVDATKIVNSGFDVGLVDSSVSSIGPCWRDTNMSGRE